MKELNLDQVKNFINNANRETLNEVADTFNKAFRALIQNETSQFNIGDRVKVTHKKFAKSLRVFTVKNLNKKTVTIGDALGTFRVSPNLLETVEG